MPFIPRSSGDSVLTSDDETAVSVTTVTFPFGNASFIKLYVSIELAFYNIMLCIMRSVSFQVGSNGIISFGSVFNDYSNIAYTSSLPKKYLVAPFWNDIDISNGGTISYEIFDSGYYLEQVNAYIQRQRHNTFQGTWMMNVYYKQVAPFVGLGSSEVNDNTLL